MKTQETTGSSNAENSAMMELSYAKNQAKGVTRTVFRLEGPTIAFVIVVVLVGCGILIWKFLG